MTLVELRAPSARAPRLAGLPVAVIGAGPIGLAAAAHLLERGQDVVVLEAGAEAAAAVREWGHIRLFSPWRLLIDPAAARLLSSEGWVAPDGDDLPTGGELVTRYLAPLAAHPALAARILTSTPVLAVSREGMDRTRSAGRQDAPFVLRLSRPDGSADEVLARAVLDTSGTWRTPNSLGSSGLDPLGIDEVRERISGPLPDVLGADRARFAGRRVAVVGAGHSAANTLLALAALAEEEAGTEILWLHRNSSAVRIAVTADDELSARASLGARLDELVSTGAIDRHGDFEIVRLAARDARVAITGRRGDGLEVVEVDAVVGATGFRPDLGMLREIRLDLDEVVEAPRRLAPLIDPNVHSCGTVAPHGAAELEQPEPDFFLAGMKSYGRAPTFLLATGYEQVRSIAARLAGNDAEAREVRLVLPATGVCSSGTAASCC